MDEIPLQGESIDIDNFEADYAPVNLLITKQDDTDTQQKASASNIDTKSQVVVENNTESSNSAVSKLPARLNRGVPKLRTCVDNYAPLAKHVKRVKTESSVRESKKSSKLKKTTSNDVKRTSKNQLDSTHGHIQRKEIVDIDAQSTSSSIQSSSITSDVQPFVPPTYVLKYTHPLQLPIPVYHSIPKEPPLLPNVVSLEENSPDIDASTLSRKSTEDAHYADRIELLVRDGRMIVPVCRLGNESFHSFLKPQKHPDVLVDHWGTFIDHAEYFSSLVKLEYKYKVNVTRKLSRMIQSHFNQVAGEDDRLAKEYAKASKSLARWTAKEVQKKWKLAVHVIRKRKTDAAKMEQDKVGRAHLNRILEQSHQILDKQRGDLLHSADSNKRSQSSRSASASTSQKGDSSPMHEHMVEDESVQIPSRERSKRLRSTCVSSSELRPTKKIKRISRESSTVSSHIVSPADIDLDIDKDDKEFVGEEEDDIILDSDEDGEEEEEEMDQLKKEAEMSIEELIKLHYGERKPEAMVIGNSLTEKNLKIINSSEQKSTGGVHSHILSQVEVQKVKNICNDQDSIAELHPQKISSVISSESESTSSEDDQPSKLQQPFLLRGQLREYQHAGFEWLVSLHKNGKNGILADEMGLGKTIQTIALLAHLACEQGIWGPHLIVVPTSVMLNWEMEFKKFLPGFKVLTYYGSIKERKAKRVGWNQLNSFNVCITSYQLIIADQQIFRRKAWHYMVLDEAHNIKSFKSQRWQTMLGFNTKFRLLLSGTPIQNNLVELWALLYFLMPQGLGDHFQAENGTTEGMGQGFANLKDFQEWFGGIEGSSGAALEKGGNMDSMTKTAISKLQTILRPFLLRRLKIDVEKQMPLKHEHVVHCRLSKRQRYLYDEFMARAQTKDTLSSGNYLSIINCLMQLRKVCNHPDLFEVRAISTSFAMPNIPENFQPCDLLIRRRLLEDQDEKSCSLLHGKLIYDVTHDKSPFAAISRQHLDASSHFPIDPILPELDLISSRSVNDYQRVRKQILQNASTKRWQSLQTYNRIKCQEKPVVSTLLHSIQSVFLRQKPKPIRGKTTIRFEHVQNDAALQLNNIVDKKRPELLDLVSKFACITPAVQALGLPYLALPGVREGDALMAGSDLGLIEYDILHPSAVKLQIAFPDPSLLQYDCGKLQALADLLRNFKEGGHRVLIFTQMTKVLDLLEIFLNFHGHRYLRLDGSTKVEDRQLLTERFNTDDRILAFILSSRSGGVGINLTGADCVVFYDSDWNPAMDKQCQDRCHRIGQTRDVNIYRLVSTHTIEENMLKKAQQKIFLDKVVVQDGDFTTEHFAKLDWRDMLGDDLPMELRSKKPEISVNTLKSPKVMNYQDTAQEEHTISSLDSKEIETAFALAEDEDDAKAAKLAEQERQLDDGDFREDQPVIKGSISRLEADDDEIIQDDGEDDDQEGGSIDEWMLNYVEKNWELFS